MPRRFTLALVATTALAAPAWAATVEVGSGESLQAAVDRAQPGDVVRVQPGTYAPFVFRRSGVTVESAIRHAARIVDDSREGAAVGSYGEDDVTLRGFVLEGGNGVKMGGSPGNMARGIRVLDNVVETAREDGLKFFQAEGVDVSGNVIRESGTARDNHDGGIDWVQVTGSRMVGNRVSSVASCAMVKNGSANNLISGNDFTACGVHGIDMVAPSSGAAAGANGSGLIAYDNVIEDNRLRGGTGCGVALHPTQTRGNRVAGNAVVGRDCGNGNPSNNPSVRPGTPDRDSPLERNLGRVGDNVGNTDEQVWRSIDAGTSRAWREVQDILSGGGIVRGVNRGINTVTGTVTRGIRRGANGAIDTVTQPVEDAVDAVGAAISCSVGGTVMGGVGSVLSGIFGGGRATIGGQLAGMAMDAAGNLCEARQLSVQKETLKYAMLGNESGEADPSEGIGEYLGRVIPALGDGGFLEDEQAVAGAYETAYPDMFDAMSPDDLIDTDARLSRQARRAEVLSFQVGNRALSEQARGVARAAGYAAQGREGPGIRAELQAGNAIAAENVAALNGLTAAQVAGQRAAAEVRLRDEARKAAANRAAEDFMTGFGRCGDCDTPFKPSSGNF